MKYSEYKLMNCSILFHHKSLMASYINAKEVVDAIGNILSTRRTVKIICVDDLFNYISRLASK